MPTEVSTADLASLVTVAVSPRERHFSLVHSLLSLFATIPPGVRIVVAQGDIPAELRPVLDDLRALRRFDLIETPYPLYPQEARNLCLETVETDFVVIADNDIEYEPGWLEALVRNAVSNEADVVAPLIFIGPPRATEIHHAGGRIEVTATPGGELLAREVHQLAHTTLSENAVAALGTDNHTVEFHCFLIRRSYAARFGLFDERMTTQEQIHYGLLARHLGARVTFEGKARVTYIAKLPFSARDLEYLSFRWNDGQAIASMRAVEAMWGIRVGELNLLNSWVRRHRTRAFGTLYSEQRRSMDVAAFYSEFVKPLEAKSVERARELRAGKALRFPKLPDQDRTAGTVRHFLVESRTLPPVLAAAAS